MEVTPITHLEKVIAGEVSAVAHLEKVIAKETTAITYTEKVTTGEAPPITHLEKVIAGIVDPITHLEHAWAGRAPEPTEREYTGAVPVTITADGTPLLDYLISGNMSQTGTPTPSNPVDVNGVGVRTENLWDGAIGLDNTQILKSNGITTASPNYALSDYIPISASTSYVYSFRHNQYEPNRTSFTVSFYKSDKQLVQQIVLQNINDEGIITIPFTTPAGAKYVRINWEKPYDDMLMLNLGETAIPYEPYGYKIPISSGGVTTNIYLGSTQTVRVIKKLVLTGGEGWNSTAIGTNHFFYTYTSDSAPIYTAIPSTHYTPSNEQGALRPNNSIRQTAFGTRAAINIRDEACATIPDFKAYLAQQYAAGTPVTVWYVLANSETGTINEPLMKIGDYADTVSMEQAGVQIPTLHGNTVIDVLTELKPSQMYIKYQK